MTVNVLRYTIPLAPVTKKNSQRILVNSKTGKPFIAPSSAYKNYAKSAAWYLKPRPTKPISIPVEVKCLFFMPTRRRVDRVNLEEAVYDILVECGILADDCRDVIASADGTRVFCDKINPRTEIEISALREDYEQWREQ